MQPESMKGSWDPVSGAPARMPEKIVVLIPAYNEARFIGSTVIKALKYAGCVLVVDDGSLDGTAEIAHDAGALVIRHPVNCGKGAALNTGLQAARRLQPQAVVLLDADGQHLPEEIPRLVEPILKDEADIMIGSRYLGQGSCVPGERLVGHRLFNLVTRLVAGEPSSDSQCGFRAISGKALERLRFSSTGFSVESEMQFLAHEHGLRIQEAKVTVLYQDRPKRSVFYHGMLVLGGLIKLTGQYRPLLSFGLLGGGLFLTGGILCLNVLEIYIRSGKLAIVPALISGLLLVFGLILGSTGFTLHSIRGLLREMLKGRIS